MSAGQKSQENNNSEESLIEDSTEEFAHSNPVSTLITLILTIFFDIFRVIGVCILGIPDKSKDFLNNIEMAERYQRWGEDQNELQDFVTALNYCKNAPDEDASKGEMIVRKYKVMFVCMNAMIWNTFNEFKISFYSNINDYKILLEDLISTRKDFNKKINEIKKLYHADSIFNAQEVELQAERVRSHLNRVIYKRQALIESNNFEFSFKSAIEAIENYQNNLNQLIVLFNNNGMVNSAQKEKVVYGVGEKSESIKQELNNFSPYNLRQEYKKAEKTYNEDTFKLENAITTEDENGKIISHLAEVVEKEKAESLKPENHKS